MEILEKEEMHNEDYVEHTASEESKREVKKGVMEAYYEIVNKLKVVKANSADIDEDNNYPLVAEENDFVKSNIIKSASSESADELAKNLAELKLYISKSLDGIKVKLTAEYEKFHILRQAISYSQDELKNLYDITTNVNTLSQIVRAQKEKEETFEREMAERRQAFENEKLQTEKERFREQTEYMKKRDDARARDQKQYEFEKRALQEELMKKRSQLEDDFEAREAALAARELEHQQLKDREVRILAREQEYAQLREKEIKHFDELRAAVAKAEIQLQEQLIKRHEYDLKLKQIEWESERKLDQQKIAALEQQIEQYKSLKPLFND